MHSEYLFTLALGVKSPWKITNIDLKPTDTSKALHIEIGFEKGSKFPDEAGKLCSVHDTKARSWRHLNFFQHACYLHCKVPRIKTSEGKVCLVEVPWARKQSGFTLLFESFAMLLIEKEMPVKQIGGMLKENPHRIWRIFNYWVDKAHTADMVDKVETLGLDETSKKKGHNYVTVAVDIEKRRVINVVEGKDKEAVKQVKEALESKGLDANKVKHASIDMSPSFVSGISEYFPKAEIHFDRFHVVKLLNKAMDEVRRLERKEHAELKGHKYTFLKNKDNLSQVKQQSLANLIKLFPTLGEAYRLKELFNDVWEMETAEEATAFLVDWCEQVESKGIGPFKNFIKTIRSCWSGIVNFCETEINNGILEGINAKIQLAKRRARGFRSEKNFINMIYLLCGKLKFDYPPYSA